MNNKNINVNINKNSTKIKEDITAKHYSKIIKILNNMSNLIDINSDILKINKGEMIGKINNIINNIYILNNNYNINNDILVDKKYKNMEHLQSDRDFILQLLKKGGATGPEKQQIFQLYKKWIDPTHLSWTDSSCNSCSSSILMTKAALLWLSQLVSLRWLKSPVKMSRLVSLTA